MTVLPTGAKSWGDGRYIAGEWHAGWYPRLWKFNQSKRGILFFGGRTSTLWGPVHYFMTDADVQRAGRELVQEWPIAAFPYGSGQHWGNDTAISRVATARSFAETEYGWATDKVFLFSISMGTLAAMNWARQNVTSVAAIACAAPAVDLDDLHDNEAARGIPAGEIDAAYGGSAAYETALPTHNPTAYAAELEGIPIRCWYSSDDTTVIPSTVTNFAGLISSADAVSMGNVGHSISGLGTTAVSEFFRSVN